jgi:hypothetical protein
MDAQAVGGGYDRWRIFQRSTWVPTQKKPGKWHVKLFSAAARALAFSVWLFRPPSLALELTGDLDKEEKPRREERLRPWGGAYVMRRWDRRATV